MKILTLIWVLLWQELPRVSQLQDSATFLAIIGGIVALAGTIYGVIAMFVKLRGEVEALSKVTEELKILVRTIEQRVQRLDLLDERIQNVCRDVEGLKRVVYRTRDLEN